MKKQTHTRHLGILGGTFDPPHIGHMLMAQTALEQLPLDEVIFVPAGTPPHKHDARITSAEHRHHMVRAATAQQPAFSVNALELGREGRSYTIDTIDALRRQHPDAELFFLIGADSLTELHQWMRIEELLPLCRFITFVRPGEPLQRIKDGVAKLPLIWQARLMADIIVGRAVNLSSTEIRQRVADSLPIRYLVPDEVVAYINEHELYYK